MSLNKIKMDSKIIIHIGPMFSGKSTELLRKISTFRSIGLSCLLINHSYDNRVNEQCISTHSNLKKEAIQTKYLMDIKNREEFFNTDVIGIDEAQFFDDLYDFVSYIHKCHNKTLIISGLDGDHLQKRFGQILDCIPLCDELVKLSALCMICKNGNKASFSKRIVNSNEQILVGNEESYIAVCRKCLNQN